MFRPTKLSKQRVRILLALVTIFGASSAQTGALANNRLPPVVMDSFVKQAAGQAELIYGDESHDGPPPYELFTADHRINAGIFHQRDAGLTTGHGSLLPDAWGKDEFLGQEWSVSGSNGANSQTASLPTYGTPGTTTNSTQFPGGESNFDWLDKVDENTNRPEPLPVQWNQQNAAVGDPTRWVALGNGSWQNSTTGETISPDGTTTYGKISETRSGTFSRQ